MEQTNALKGAIDRRSFVKNGLTAAGLATAGVGLLSTSSSVLAEEEKGERSGRLSRGDAALLRFAAAAEILETDFWVQYNELCGIPDSEVPGGSGNPAFTTALSVLDSDVTHSLLVPDLHVNALTTQGHPAEVTLTPDKVGAFAGKCGHFCGKGHGTMKFIVHVKDNK